MQDGRIKIYGKWEHVKIINIQIIPKIKMVRNDLEYSLEQENKFHVIYLDVQGKLQTEDYHYLSDIQVYHDGFPKD